MRPPRFSPEENAFEMKVWNALLHFRRGDAVFFHKKVTATMVTALIPGPFAYSLEFPAKFVDAHAQLFRAKCTFERPNLDRKWPITITVRRVKKLGMKNRVFAYGEGGWLNFVMENRIEIGDALFVSLLEVSRFEVHIIRKPSEQPVNLLRQFKAVAPVNLLPRPNSVAPVNLLSWRNSEAPVNPLPRPNAKKPCKAGGVTQNPWFVATVKTTSLEVPGPFWERYRKMLGSDQLHLECTCSKDIMVVEAKRSYVCEEEVVLTVRLERGWTGFVIANHLQVGSYLQFTLVSPSFFKVNVLNCF